MKIIKRFFSLVAVFSFMFTAMPVRAESADDRSLLDQKVYIWGKVEAVGTNRIQIINSNDASNDCILNIGEETAIIDAVSGNPVRLDSLKRLDRIAAYVSPVMTKSLPPITNAAVVFVNVPEDYKVPRYLKVGEILEADDETVRVLSADQTLIASFKKDITDLFAYRTKNIVGFDDIHVNDTFVVWYEVEMLSMPGQAVIQKAMKLPEKKQGWQLENEHWYYYEEGIKVIDTWIASTNGRWYYVDLDGKMAVNTVVNGYAIDENGVYQSEITEE